MYQLVNLCFSDKMQNLSGVEEHFSVTNYFSENLISYSGRFYAISIKIGMILRLYTFGVSLLRSFQHFRF